MAISIYSKYQMDIWTHLKEVSVLSDEDSNEFTQTSSSKWFINKLYSNSTDVSWDDWSEIHSILFDSYSDDKITFCRDSVGFIPPHILSIIVKSKRFKGKYESLKRDYNEQFEIALNYEYATSNDEEEYYDEPDEEILEKSSRMLEILDFIIKFSNEGISYS